MRRSRSLRLSLPLLALATALVAACAPVEPPATPPVPPDDGSVGSRPYLGWSSWSLQALQDGRNPTEKMTAALLEQQSDVMADKLGAYGYRYINMDSFWWSGYDAYGRQEPDPVRFPEGISGVADHVHTNGQKFGTYAIAGLAKEVYDADSPILGTSCTARDIALQPLTLTNTWQDHWAIDFSNPCAQAYVDSRVQEFADWGVDFLKLDGVLPTLGGDLGVFTQGLLPVDNQADVAAWRRAIERAGRPMWLTLSWDLSPRAADTWAAYADAVRITGDVECYCRTLTTWRAIEPRFDNAPLWTEITERTGLRPDFDSLNVADGARDGLTDTERRTAATLWAIGGSPWYLGDDLTRIDDLGVELLTDPDVLALVKEGRALRPVSTSGLAPRLESQLLRRQTWVRREVDGSAIVAVFNLADEARTLDVPPSVTGLGGVVRVQDLWSDADLGTSLDTYRPTLPAHGAALVRLRPA